MQILELHEQIVALSCFATISHGCNHTAYPCYFLEWYNRVHWCSHAWPTL